MLCRLKLFLKIGKKSTMRILVVNDDEPGTFTFDKRSLYVKESCGAAVISVLRENGADGTVEVRRPFKAVRYHMFQCKWRTIAGTAVDGEDYLGGQGVLLFQNGELKKEITIQVLLHHPYLHPCHR